MAFSMEEVFSALLNLSEDKAPRPDGFSMASWHFNWDFVKSKVKDCFREFYDQGNFERSLNVTFLY